MTYTGPTTLTLLTLIFIYCKLAGYIAWSWWWVLSPLWIPVLLFTAIASLWIGIIAFIHR